MKGVGMFVDSLRGVNFGFWSHLGCSGKTPSYLAVKVSFRVVREKIYRNIYLQEPGAEPGNRLLIFNNHRSSGFRSNH